ncbi:MAG: DNA polymerase III subunit delta [Candidatus Omnitrophica bacterium]|nr:DNA polymerase III subunit delta [Candidatus Omnitrophota bacterium]
MVIKGSTKGLAGRYTPGVYLFSGEEDFLKEEEIANLKRSLAAKNESSDYQLFRAGERPLGDILDTARTIPFMGSVRLIILKGVERLSPAEKESTLSYIKKPSPHTYLILDAQTIKPSEAIYKTLRTASRSISFKRLVGWELEKWIKESVSGRHKRIDAVAIVLLKENVGNDLRALSSAVDKLVTFVGDRGVITHSDVESLIGLSVESSVFGLTDRIGRRDLAAALALCRKLTADKKRLPELLGVLGWQMKRLWRAKEYEKAENSGQAIVEKLAIRTFRQEKFLKQLPLFTIEGIKRSLELILAADVKAKRGGDPALLLDRLVVDLCKG